LSRNDKSDESSSSPRRFTLLLLLTHTPAWGRGTREGRTVGCGVKCDAGTDQYHTLLGHIRTPTPTWIISNSYTQRILWRTN